jgi:hypothetical protein
MLQSDGGTYGHCGICGGTGVTDLLRTGVLDFRLPLKAIVAECVTAWEQKNRRTQRRCLPHAHTLIELIGHS